MKNDSMWTTAPDIAYRTMVKCIAQDKENGYLTDVEARKFTNIAKGLRAKGRKRNGRRRV